MTVYQGVNYAKTQATPISQIEEGQYNSPVLKILDQFVLTADLVLNDQILVGGPIQQGAVVLNAKVGVPIGLGGSAAIGFGILAGPTSVFAGAPTAMAQDLTAFFAALPVSSATWASSFGSTYQGDYYTQTAYTSNAQPVITCSVATSGATGKSIYVEIDYTKNGG